MATLASVGSLHVSCTAQDAPECALTLKPPDPLSCQRAQVTPVEQITQPPSLCTSRSCRATRSCWTVAPGTAVRQWTASLLVPPSASSDSSRPRITTARPRWSLRVQPRALTEWVSRSTMGQRCRCVRPTCSWFSQRTRHHGKTRQAPGPPAPAAARRPRCSHTSRS